VNEPGYRSEDELREQLRQLRVDPRQDDGFGDSLRRRLVEAGPPPTPGLWERFRTGVLRVRWAGPLAGAMAGAAIALALTLLHGGPGRQAPASAATAEISEVPASKVAVVWLALTADVAVADANLRVTLPDGLVFWSDGEALPVRSFEWRQPLAQGRNEFPIAVRGKRPGVYRLRLTAQVGNASVEHDVTLSVVDG
jgi:hypothetical protein